MKNFVKAFVNGISTAGRAVGKGQRVMDAVTKDEDGDGTPEYKEALNGLMKMVDKFKLETLPALKEFWEKFIVLGTAATNSFNIIGN